MDDDDYSWLLCYEDNSFLLGIEHFLYEAPVPDNSSLREKEELVYKDYNITAYDEQCVRMFFDKELSCGFQKNASSVLSDYLKHVRLEAIAWILKTRANRGLHFRTAYLSVMFFDRFISAIHIDTVQSKEMELLPTTCLLLAAKMEESKGCRFSQFLPAECNFQIKDMRRMEDLTLETLQWRMNSVTPFDFLHFFTKRLCKKSESSQDHISETAPLILAVMREINLMEYRPSVIAAAATLMTLDPNLTRETLELTVNSISDCPVLEVEDVFTCYGLMQRLHVSELNKPKPVISPDLLPMNLNAALEDTATSSAVCTKRKGLISVKPDDSHDKANKRRHS